jgi:uncharacterized protein YndB with AHSA1/START domain
MQRTEPTTRAIEVRIEVDAPPDAVWRALTEAEQLESWFPLNARVTPGAGGSIWASWGGASTYESRITVWEPGRHLRLIDHEADPEKGMAVPVAQDYFIEGKAGGTVLRFVHSGFSHDTEWDEMLDTMSSGWRYFFFNLKHYVEKHAGVHRAMVWTRRAVTDRPRAQGWSHILEGLGIDPAAREGDPFSVTIGGESFSGTVAQRNEPVHFAGTLPDLNEGLLFLELEPGEKWHLGFWLSTYSVEPERVERLQKGVDATVDAILGKAVNG